MSNAVERPDAPYVPLATDESASERFQILVQRRSHGSQYSDDEQEVVAPEPLGVLAKATESGTPFPVDPDAPPEHFVLTWRSILVGSSLGLIVGASNIYIGLKTGFSFGASLFGAIFGYAILKPLSNILSEKWGGGYFGPKENCTVQSAATASGALTTLFVAVIPAMYHLGLMTTPQQDMGKLIWLTTISSYYGTFFAIPLRKYYILQQKLVFPTPTATAHVIHSLHANATPSARRTASRTIRIMSASFIFALIFKTISTYVPGLLWDWHVFWWLYQMLGVSAFLSLESWGWWIEFTPAFLSAGALSGLNASWSFMLGSILAWGVIGPLTVWTGVATGQPVDAEKYPGYMYYMSVSSADPVNSPSPRYWMLWPGVMVMLVYSFAEIFWSMPTFYRGFRSACTRLFGLKPISQRPSGPLKDEELDDPAPPHEQVKTWQWAGGLLLSSTATLAVGKFYFDMNVGVGLVALFLAFIFSFIGVQSSGTTDFNPVATIAKASQLVTGGITRGQGMDIKKAQNTNLLAGAIAAQAASHSVDMVGDLKTGHLLGASPVSQFWAQVAGCFLGIWQAVGLFILFASAYPCITDSSIECTSFGMPGMVAWKSVTEAVTRPELPIPPSSAKTAIALGIAAGVTVPIKHLLVPEEYRSWVPNWSGIGLGFVVPQAYYPIAMVIGAHIAHYWEAKSLSSWEIWGYSLSAGLIAGEGIGGMLIAILVIFGVDGQALGTGLGCPRGVYCG